MCSIGFETSATASTAADQGPGTAAHQPLLLIVVVGKRQSRIGVTAVTP